MDNAFAFSSVHVFSGYYGEKHTGFLFFPVEPIETICQIQSKKGDLYSVWGTTTPLQQCSPCSLDFSLLLHALTLTTTRHK